MKTNVLQDFQIRIIVCIRVSLPPPPPPSKTLPLFLAKPPLPSPSLNQQTVQALQSPPLYWFFVKVGFFSEPPKY